MTRSTIHAELATAIRSAPVVPVESADRGRTVESPRQLPARGWKDVLVRMKEASKRDHIMLLSAGVAFFGLLALVPALVALLSIYGLVADPDRIDDQLLDALSAAPAEVRDLISQQLRDIGDASSGALVAVIGGILLALWSASSGMKNFIEAINQAYDEEDSRGLVEVRGLSLAFTTGALLFLIVAFTAIALLPSLLASSSLGSAGRILVSVARFVVLFFGLLAGLAVLYRSGPDREAAKWSWVSPGAIFASVL